MDAKRLFARRLRNGATDAERMLWRHLKNCQIEGFRFRRQVSLGVYVVDFLCPQAKFIVELDGGQHGDQITYDQQRTAWLNGQGYRELRFWNHDVLKRVDVVVGEIHRELTKSFTPPQPSGPAGRSSVRELPLAVRKRTSSPPSLREREGDKR